MPFARTLATGLLAMVLAFGATGCGGGKSYSGAEPDVWVPNFCRALTDMIQGMDASSARMRADLRGGKDVEVVKARFIVWLKEVEDLAGASIAKIGAVGPPAIKDGPAIQHDLEALFADEQAVFTRAIGKAEQLSTTNISAFDAGVNSIANDIDQEMSAVDFHELTKKYDDEALDDASKKYPACESFE
jgi:hypothetical protein